MQDVLALLSTPRGLRGQAGNQDAAAVCLEDPEALAAIVAGLGADNVSIRADCAETLTLVAARRPEAVAPWADRLCGQLRHKNTRLRWECAHALALCVGHLPADDPASPLKAEFVRLLEEDASIVVRDYAADGLLALAGRSPRAANDLLESLLAAAEVHDGRHAGRVLEGLCRLLPGLDGPPRSVEELALRAAQDVRPRVRKAATRLGAGLRAARNRAEE